MSNHFEEFSLNFEVPLIINQRFLSIFTINFLIYFSLIALLFFKFLLTTVITMIFLSSYLLLVLCLMLVKFTPIEESLISFFIFYSFSWLLGRFCLLNLKDRLILLLHPYPSHLLSYLLTSLFVFVGCVIKYLHRLLKFRLLMLLNLHQFQL